MVENDTAASEGTEKELSPVRKAFLLGVFVTALGLTCSALINGNGVRAMWRRAGIPCHVGGCIHTLPRRALNSTGDTEADDDSARKLEGDAEGRKLDGGAEGGKLDGGAEGGKLDGDADGRKLDGGADARKLDGDAEGRKLEGDADRRKLDGDAEGRKLEGDAEGGKLDGEAKLDRNGNEVSPNAEAASEGIPGETEAPPVPAPLKVEGVPQDPNHSVPDLAGDAAAKNTTTGRASEFCPVAEAEMKQWLKMFQSSEMVFAFTGFLLDVVGPRYTFFVGETMLLGSIGMMAWGHYWWAMLVSGATTQLILNPCMCIGNVFVESRNLVMATLSASADLAQFLFPMAFSVGSAWVAFDYQAFLIFWASAAGASAVAGLLLLPDSPFPEPLEKDGRAQSEATPLMLTKSNSIGSVSPAGVGARSEVVSEATGLPLWKAPVSQQLVSTPFILFTLVWAQMAIRLNAYLDANEDILRQYGDDGSMGTTFGYLLPLSFIPCVLVGVLADKLGVVNAVGIINITAIIVNVLSLIPSLRLQWVTLCFFIVFKSALFCTLFSFVAEVFGFTNFGTLTAVMSFVGGIANYVAGLVFIPWAAEFGSWFWPNVVFLVMGLVGHAAILYLVRSPPVPMKHVNECETKLQRKRLTAVAGWVGSSRVSVSGLVGDGEKSLAKLDRFPSDPMQPKF